MTTAAGAGLGADAARSPSRFGGWSIAAARILLGLLWLQNSGWKTPPDFGMRADGGLYRFTMYAVEHEVFAPYAHVVREFVLPNFILFGWTVLIVEASLGGFLLIGLATRFWALVGVAQSTAIALSVLATPGEWSWSYYLMIAGHLAIFGAAGGRYAGLDGVLRPVWERRRSAWVRLLLRMS
jgi:thiosulfate dehydrogenase [quinone] large subunit